MREKCRRINPKNI